MEVDIRDANISELVEAAAAGQEVVLMKDGRPVARLVPGMAIDDARLHRARNAESLGRFRDGYAKRLQHVLAQQFAGVPDPGAVTPG